MQVLDEKAIRLRREYYRNYYQENKEEINERQRKWRKDNPEKKAEYNRKYWRKKAKEAALDL